MMKIYNIYNLSQQIYKSFCLIRLVSDGKFKLNLSIYIYIYIHIKT